MTVLITAAGFVAFIYAIYFFASLSADCDPVPFWWKRLRGKEIIFIRCTHKGVIWRATIETDPWGRRFAYRYPRTKVGPVSLNPDGTGEGIWPIKWTPENPKALMVMPDDAQLPRNNKQ